MSRQRNANRESQLMTLLSVKFPFVREGVATDDGITEKTRRRARGGKEDLSRKQSRDISDFVWVFCLGSSLGKRISLLQFKAIVMNHLLKSLRKQVTCSIFLDTYTEPKTLSYLYAFCCECLERHATENQRQRKFRCHECQAKIDLPWPLGRKRSGYETIEG